MFAREKQMIFTGKHSCIYLEHMLLSNADLTSYTGGKFSGTVMGWSFHQRNRSISI